MPQITTTELSHIREALTLTDRSTVVHNRAKAIVDTHLAALLSADSCTVTYFDAARCSTSTEVWESYISDGYSNPLDPRFSTSEAAAKDATEWVRPEEVSVFKVTITIEKVLNATKRGKSD